MNVEEVMDSPDDIRIGSIAEFLKIVVDTELPDVLAHYTTTEALLSMVEKGELWFSHARFLSDTTELEYGMDVIAEAFGEREAELQDCGFADGMKYHGLYPIKPYLSDLFDKAVSPYIFCLCEKANQLSQWRQYSVTNGYSIGFSPKGLLNLKPGAKSQTLGIEATFLCKVLYEKKQQSEVANKVIAVIVQRCGQLRAKGVTAKDKPMLDFLSVAARTIMDCVIKFKDNCFHEEQEWRAYRWVAEGEQSILNYRRKGDSIMPYLVVKNPDAPNLLPITLIYFSSSFDHEIRDKGLRMFFKSKGYDVNVLPNGYPPFR